MTVRCIASPHEMRGRFRTRTRLRLLSHSTAAHVACGLTQGVRTRGRAWSRTARSTLWPKVDVHRGMSNVRSQRTERLRAAGLLCLRRQLAPLSIGKAKRLSPACSRSLPGSKACDQITMIPPQQAHRSRNREKQRHPRPKHEVRDCLVGPQEQPMRDRVAQGFLVAAFKTPINASSPARVASSRTVRPLSSGPSMAPALSKSRTILNRSSASGPCLARM